MIMRTFIITVLMVATSFTLCKTLRNCHNASQNGWECSVEFSSCYNVYCGQTYSKAQSTCQEFGAHLAVISSQSENAWIVDRLDGSGSWKRAWIGYNDMATEQVFQWVPSSSSSNFTNWAGDKPNNDHYEEKNCVALNNDVQGMWKVHRCGQEIEPVCETDVIIRCPFIKTVCAVETNVLNYTLCSNHSSMISECHYTFNAADFYGNTETCTVTSTIKGVECPMLSFPVDTFDYIYSSFTDLTNCVSVSDNETVKEFNSSDQIETLPATFTISATDSSDCPSGLECNTEFSTCYSYHWRKSYEDAKSTCKKSGGHLPVISDEKKNDWLFKYLNRHKPGWRQAWIGLNDIKDEQNFQWVSSFTDYTYREWNDQRNNNNEDRDCVAMQYRSGGMWKVRKCHSEKNTVCETDIVIECPLNESVYSVEAAGINYSMYNNHSRNTIECNYTLNSTYLNGNTDICTFTIKGVESSALKYTTGKFVSSTESFPTITSGDSTFNTTDSSGVESSVHSYPTDNFVYTNVSTIRTNFTDWISLNDSTTENFTIISDPTESFPTITSGDSMFNNTTDSTGVESSAISYPTDNFVYTNVSTTTNFTDWISLNDSTTENFTIISDPTESFPTITSGDSMFNNTTDSTGVESSAISYPTDNFVYTNVSTTRTNFTDWISLNDSTTENFTIVSDPTESFPTITSGDSMFNNTTDSTDVECLTSNDFSNPVVKTQHSDTSGIVHEMHEFERIVVSQIKEIQTMGMLIYDEDDYVGMAMIQRMNESQVINSNLKMAGSKVEFGLHLEDHMKNEMLIVFAYHNVTLKTESFEENFVSKISGLDVEFKNLVSKMFSCSIYDISSSQYLSTKLNFTIVENMTMLYTEEDVKKEPVCIFYNESLQSWSDEGMLTTSYSEHQVVCHSQHLTSFSVLMKVSPNKVSEKDAKTLSLMSRICLSMSIIALIVSFAVFCTFQKLWNSVRYSIHRNLVINMILMQSLFIFGVDKTSNKIFCRIISIFLHLTSLNTFSWMCGEAVYLYFKVSTSGPHKYNRIQNFLTLCYGIPLIIVALSAGFASNYDVDAICWLTQETGMIWTFVLPAICIALFNTVIMCTVVKKIFERSGTMVGKSRAERNLFRQLRKAAQGTVMLLPLFGTTWIIGPFAMSGHTVFLDYLFNILNASQGIAIFFLYCVFDKQIQECFCKHFKNRVGVHSTVMTSKV